VSDVVTMASMSKCSWTFQFTDKWHEHWSDWTMYVHVVIRPRQ